MSTDYPAYTAPEIPEEYWDDSVSRYHLPSCDVQEHVFVTRTYDNPIVVVHSTEGLDVEKLRAEILMASYAAQVRYDNLPKDVKKFDRDVVKQAFVFQERNAKDMEQ